MTYRGIVAGGSARASTLGYPTANIPLTDDISGVYAARVLIEGEVYKSVAFADPSRKILEAHLFGFSGNLYGKEIGIELVEKIRETRPLKDDASLREAMIGDAKRAREILA